MADKITVMVTGVGGGGVGRQVIKALKLTGDYNVVATDMTRISMGLEDSLNKYIVPRAKDSAYIATIVDIIEKEEVKYVVPGSEPELWELSLHRDIVEKTGAKLLINLHGTLETCMDKEKTVKFLDDNNYPFPQSVTIGAHEWSMYRQYVAEMLPVVIKPTVASGGSLNVYIAQEMDEVDFLVRYLQRQGLIPMVQEYIGSYNQEYTVGVMANPLNGNVVSTVVLKRFTTSGLSSRIRQINRHRDRESREDMLVVSSGISQGEIVRDEKIEKFCGDLAIGLGARGPINVQCRVNKDKVYVFEVNPRFSGTTYIRVLAGVNEPDNMIKLLEGQELSEIKVRPGLCLRGLEEKFVPER